MPGSPRPLGPGLSPEAPPGPPAPGGRAPSFGSPTDNDAWSFRFGGRVFAYDTVGIGSKPILEQSGQTSSPLHSPARIEGRLPFGTGAALTLNMSYGTAVVGAAINYTVNTTGKEYAGLYNSSAGAAANSAYVTVTPQPLGNLRLQVKAGAFSDSFAGTGQWGWGVLGPLIGVRGYGEEIIAEYQLTSDLSLFFEHGFLAVPGVPEFFVRGTYAGWNTTGVSTVMQHGHVGFNYRGKYQVKLHAANAAGADEERLLAAVDPSKRQLDCSPQTTRALQQYCNAAPRDGRMDALAIESHTFLDQWGQFGLSAAYYRLVTAAAVSDGFWWTVDWTQGARETTFKYLGPNSGGTGSFAAISAQYDFSLANLLWYPQAFDGRGPDLRASVAAIYHKTLSSDDAQYQNASGYQLGVELEYRILPWFAATLRSYGTHRNPSTRPVQNSTLGTVGNNFVVAGEGDYTTFNVTPGLLFRRDWQAPERIEITYSRFFYSHFLDINPYLPFDRNVVTVGASLSF